MNHYRSVRKIVSALAAVDSTWNVQVNRPLCRVGRGVPRPLRSISPGAQHPNVSAKIALNLKLANKLILYL